MSEIDARLDLAEASGVELAEFAQRHGVALERLERCQEYLRASAPIRAKFELLAVRGGILVDGQNNVLCHGT